MRVKYFLNILALVFTLGVVVAFEDTGPHEGTPEKKLISTFQIVRFPNDACKGTSTRNGTCYTSAECSDKGGSSSGSCADGFGVCCTFVVNKCEGASSENITYWDAPTGTYLSTLVPTTCQLKVCPTNNNICQLRIDFKTFVITGPSTSSLSEISHVFGSIPSGGAADPAATTMSGSWRTNCLVDTFSVSSKNVANSPPVVCGTLSAAHMYVDANVDDCNVLTFHFNPQSGPAAAAAAGDTRGVASVASTRDWDMTVYQYECGHINAAPPGCTEYLHGNTKGFVKSYNYGNMHLANQNQKICIRRERGYCFACFTATGVANFGISGDNTGGAYTYPGLPCGYGCETAAGISAGTGTQCAGYDCVIVPDAWVVAAADGTIINPTTTNYLTNLAATYRRGCAPQISGHSHFGPGNADLNALTVIGEAASRTVCSQHVPFQLTFKSDGFEGTGTIGGEQNLAAATGAVGFKIQYDLFACPT